MTDNPLNSGCEWNRPRSPVEVDLFCLGAVVLVFLGIAQFIAGIAQAIDAYPEPFSVFNRFLSELGRDSKATAVSRRLFERSTVLLGLSMFPFFYGIARAHTEELPGQTMAFCSCGIASAMGLMGIGTSPYNRFLTLHIFFVLLWLAPMVFMVLKPLPGMKQRHAVADVAMSRAIVWGTLVYLPGMLLIPFVRPSLPSGFVWTVMLAQKALVGTAILWLAVLLRFIVIAGLQQLRPN